MIKSVKPLTVAVLIFAFCGFFSLFMSFRAPLSDFGNYYYGARIMSKDGGYAATVYDVAVFNMEVEKMGARNLFLNHATVSPQSLLIYRTVSWIGSANIAKMIFNTAGFIFFSLIFFRFLRWKNIDLTWQHLVLILAAQIPVFYNLSFGQTYLYITAFLLIAIMQAESRPWLSGVLLALAISLKISPAIFLIWFLTQRRYKVVLWTIFFCAIPLSWLLYSWYTSRDTIEFFAYSLPRMMDGFVSDPYSSSFQSVIVFLRKLMLPDAILNPSPLLNSTPLVIQLINIAIFILLSWVLVAAWKEKQEMRNKFLLLILFLCITSGYTSTYSLILLLPFVTVGASRKDWIRVSLYCILFVLPPRLFDGYSPFLEEYKLWIFIALFVWESKWKSGFQHIEKMQVVLATFLLIMVILKFAHKPESLPLTYYKPQSINHDYALNAFVENGQLNYMAYTEKGFQSFAIPYEGEGMYVQGWNYTNGVMWRQIGETDSDILLMSDYHRGPGLMHLYTVRKDQLRVLLTP